MNDKERAAGGSETWLDRLGIPVPADLLTDADLLEHEDVGAESPSELPAALQPTKNRRSSSSSDSSLGDQEAAELQEYLRQSSLHGTNSLPGDVLQQPTSLLGAQRSDEWSEWSSPKNTTSVQAGADDHWSIEEEQALYADVCLAISPPAPRTGSSALRNRRKFDGPQLRRGPSNGSSGATILKLPRKRKEELTESFSLPLQRTNSLVFGPTPQARIAGQKQRTRRRDRDRGAKSNDHLPCDEGLLSPPRERASSPPPYSPGAPHSSSFRCESLPQLACAAKSSHRCRYLSVSSRRLSEPAPAPPPSPAPVPPSPSGEAPSLPHDCLAQYAHLSALLRRTTAGGPDAATSPTGAGRKFSQEELLYQQEAGETLWLELQAWHAQLHCYTYDNLLFTQRDQVKDVIEAVLKFAVPAKPPSASSSCGAGCLSIWCAACRTHQDRALRQVAALVRRIDEVEALFPSTAKMIVLYPGWGGAEFTTRCRTLYLWYNTTLHLRQTITLLGNRLQHIAKCVIPWPSFPPLEEAVPSPLSTTQRTFSSEEESSTKDVDSSSYDQDGQKDDDAAVTSSFKLVVEQPCDEQTARGSIGRPVVRFEVGGEDDDASSSSEAQSSRPTPADVVSESEEVGRRDSSASLLSADGAGLKRSPSSLFLEANPYRKYVEKCMHSKGLHKTFEKIVEVIRDAMARTVCLMEEHQDHAHPLRSERDRLLLEYCAELRRELPCTDHLSAVPPRPHQEAGLEEAPADEAGNLGCGCHCHDSSASQGQDWQREHSTADNEEDLAETSGASSQPVPGSGDDVAAPENGDPSVDPQAASPTPRCCGCRGRADVVGCGWSGRMWAMGLPGVASLFWFLSSVPVLLVCECLSLRLAQMPRQPSQLSIRQLVRECREGLRLAVTVRRRFLRWSGAMRQHLSSPRRRRQRLASVASAASSAGDCEDGVCGAGRRESAPTAGHPHIGAPNCQRLHVPADALQTSLSAPNTPVKARTAGQAPPTAGTAPHPAGLSVQLSPLAPVSATDAAGHIFFSGDTDQHACARRQSYGSSDFDFDGSSAQQQVGPSRPDAYMQPHVAEASNFPRGVGTSAGVAGPQLIPSLGSAPVPPLGRGLAAGGPGHVDLNSTDEGVALTSPESSERSAAAGAWGCVGPAVQHLQALRQELSRRQTALLQDLDRNIETLLKVYLDWLDMYVPVGGAACSLPTTSSSSSEHSSSSGLLHEWQFVCSICPQVLHAYTLAANRFCNLAELLVREAWDTLSSGVDELTALLQSDAFSSAHVAAPSFHDASLANTVTGGASATSAAAPYTAPRPLCKRELSRVEVRRLHAVVGGSRRRMGRALTLARTLRQQLEVALQFRRAPAASLPRLLRALRASRHVRLDCVHPDYLVFAPEHLAQDLDSALVLLSLTPLPEDHRVNAGVGEVPLLPSLLLTSPSSHTQPLLVGPPATAPPTLAPRNSLSSPRTSQLSYLLLLRLDAWLPGGSGPGGEGGTRGAKAQKVVWRGPVVRLQPTAAVTIALSSLQTCDAVAVSSSASVGSVLSHLGALLPTSLLVPLQERSVPHAAVSAALAALKVVCLEVCGRLGKCVAVVAQLLHLEVDREETYRQHGDPPLSPASSGSSVTRDVLQQLYTFGFEYHRDVCRLFSSSSASELSRVVSHLVAFSQSWMRFCQQHYPPGNGARPRWSANGLDFLLYTCSPHHLRHLHKKQALAFLTEVEQCYHHVVGVARPGTAPSAAPLTPSTARKHFRSSSSSVSTRSTSESPSPRVSATDPRLGPHFPPSPRPTTFCHPGRGMARVRDSIVRLEQQLQQRRLQSRAVGQVIAAPATSAADTSPLDRYKTIGFSWHRGFKIGSGQFGKVYTAVNNSTGELLALKVQPIAHTDRKLVAKMVDELRILEGFSHPNLVKYYGMEIMEDELLFFMEYCEEGTLEHLSYSTEFGLPEEMVRRYTRQLLDGVAALHDCGVIHRDIKGANIFLTHESLNLKLGDFGCAVRLRGDRTEVGELAGIAGTHAFMAPEIFQCAGGYGRAADVWSVACVVIEMCTAKRPWPELNNSAQIMFKVGMGQSPACPPSLSKEGQDFLSKCFVHDPRDRATASTLLHHPFVKVELDEDSYSLPLYSGAQHYYAYNTAFEHSS